MKTEVTVIKGEIFKDGVLFEEQERVKWLLPNEAYTYTEIVDGDYLVDLPDGEVIEQYLNVDKWFDSTNDKREPWKGLQYRKVYRFKEQEQQAEESQSDPITLWLIVKGMILEENRTAEYLNEQFHITRKQ